MEGEGGQTARWPDRAPPTPCAFRGVPRSGFWRWRPPVFSFLPQTHPSKTFTRKGGDRRRKVFEGQATPPPYGGPVLSGTPVEAGPRRPTVLKGDPKGPETVLKWPGDGPERFPGDSGEVGGQKFFEGDCTPSADGGPLLSGASPRAGRGKLRTSATLRDLQRETSRLRRSSSERSP